MVIGVIKDGYSSDIQIENQLKSLGVKFYDKIPEKTDIIFCGGGGFIGSNIIKNNKLKNLIITIHIELIILI